MSATAIHSRKSDKNGCSAVDEHVIGKLWERVEILARKNAEFRQHLEAVGLISRAS